MKISSSYTPVIQPPQPRPAPQPSVERDSAEARLRDLIAQRHAEFERQTPFEELGKNLDVRA